MTPEDFDALVHEMTTSIPSTFLDGIGEIVVSFRTVPHPVHAGIFTLGECIPLPATDDSPEGIQSRIVLYHGSFRAIAAMRDDFDWKGEAWETLTHEIRHHLEWKARVPDLEAYDDACEQNFARQEGEPFDPMFYQGGERLAEGVFKVEDDVFFERRLARVPPEITVAWHGRHHRVRIPRDLSLPLFLSLEGLEPDPSGEVVLALHRRSLLGALFRPRPVTQEVAEAIPEGLSSRRMTEEET